MAHKKRCAVPVCYSKGNGHARAGGLSGI
jgi:hypothetical protein